MADSHTRQAKRTPVSLKIKFKSATLDQFIERYSVDVSHGGIFIRTKDPLPVGTTMRFEFQLKDASPLIMGEGTVVWTREHDPSRGGVAPGMGVRFDRLTEGSQQILEKILEQKANKSADARFTDTPTRVAPRPLVDDLAKESAPGRAATGSIDERSDTTPLPTPMPFHSDADEFPEETFEEATKVRSLDELVAASATGDVAAIKSALRGVPDDPDQDGADSGPAHRRADSEEFTRVASPQRHAYTAEEGQGERAMTTPFGARADAAEEPEALPDTPAPRSLEDAAGTRGDHEADAATPVDELARRRQARQREAEPAPTADADAADSAGQRQPSSVDKASVQISSGIPVERVDEPTAIVDRPLAARPREAEDARAAEGSHGSSMTLVLVAAVLLLGLGGAGYFLITRGKDGDDKLQAARKTQVTQPAATEQPDPSLVAFDEDPDEPSAVEPDHHAAADTPKDDLVIDDEPAPPVELATVSVRSTPSGATVTVLDAPGVEPARTPAKLELDAARTHKIRVSLAGHVSQEIEVEPARRVPVVKLEPAPMIIRVTSAPDGAYVYVDGRRVSGETPNEFVVPEAWRRRARFKVSLRKYGHDKVDVVLESQEFREDGEAFVARIDGTLPVSVSSPPAPRSQASRSGEADRDRKDAEKTRPDKPDEKEADRKGADTEGAEPRSEPGGDASKPAASPGPGSDPEPAGDATRSSESAGPEGASAAAPPS